jgi:hypothetical protein
MIHSKYSGLILAIIIIIITCKLSVAQQQCNDSSPCIRFCCVREECPTNDKNAYFNIEGQRGALNVKSEFKILRGKPCDNLFALYPNKDIDDTWHFLSVSLRSSLID